MKAELRDAVAWAPVAATWRPAVVERSLTPESVAGSGHLALCLECASADLSAEEPRARCTCIGSVYAGRSVFAGQPACSEMTARDDDDLTLAWCTPGLKAAHARFAQPRPPAR